MVSTPNKVIALPVIVGVALAVFAVDQLLKLWVVQTIPVWSLSPSFARLFKITFVTNSGTAFGMFPQLGNMFMIIAVVVISAIIIFHRQLPVDKGWVRLSLGLMLGGALGNLTDRLSRGYVVDFIDIAFWPIFNLADVAIVLGVMILSYVMWREEQAARAGQPAE